MRKAMQPQELKSLVESGHYKPDPSRIATAMLQRRGVRELLIGGTRRRQPSWSNPAGASSRPAGQPDLDPLAGDDLADRRQRRFARLARPPSRPRPAAPAAAPPAARSPRRPRPPARAGRGRPRRRSRRRPSASGSAAGVDRAGATPLARGEVAGVAAEAVAEVDHRPWLPPPPGRGRRASRGVGSSWRAAQALGGRRRRRRAASSGRSSSSRPAAAPPISPVRTSDVAGLGAAAGDAAAPAVGRVADHGDREGQRPGPG